MSRNEQPEYAIKIYATSMEPTGYVVSDHDAWIPGVYESPHGAATAALMSPDRVANLWSDHLDRHGPGCPPLTDHDMVRAQMDEIIAKKDT